MVEVARPAIDSLRAIARQSPSFGSLLRVYRVEAGLKQTELRSRLREGGYPIAEGTLSNYETGKRLPNDPDFIHYTVECFDLEVEEKRLKKEALVQAFLFDHILRLLDLCRNV